MFQTGRDVLVILQKAFVCQSGSSFKCICVDSFIIHHYLCQEGVIYQFIWAIFLHILLKLFTYFSHHHGDSHHCLITPNLVCSRSSCDDLCSCLTCRTWSYKKRIKICSVITCSSFWKKQGHPVIKFFLISHLCLFISSAPQSTSLHFVHCDMLFEVRALLKVLSVTDDLQWSHSCSASSDINHNLV